MSSVTQRINEIKQPRGGYIKPSEFDIFTLDDGITLNPNENIHGSIIGTAIDYLTRFIMGTNLFEAFNISIQGAILAEKLGVIKGATNIVQELLKEIKGADEQSIINACKVVTFDVWRRNPMSAMMAKEYKELNPDIATVQNIQTMIKRSISFWEKYGPIVKDGFSFSPINGTKEQYTKMLEEKQGNFGGYTPTVSSGDGDYLTKDTIWDFKVIKSKPTNKHTLQLLMYWIMGQHSGQEIFKGITKMGIFNPRLNTVYLLDISKISQDIIKIVENEVICY